MPEAMDVFISYAPDDGEHLAALNAHLADLRRRGRIATWSAHDLRPGDDHAAEIARHLDAAHLVLFLVSPSFLESDELWDGQLRQALARRDSHGTRVVPILLRPVDWKSPALGELDALPANGEPITRWDDTDAAWADVTRGIRRLLVRRTRRVRRRRPVVFPEAEPYRADRDSQLDALRDALSRALRTRVPRPVVAVAWGPERQGHDAFVERLTRSSLHSLLRLPRGQKLHDGFLRWPVDWRTRPRRLLERLGHDVVRDAAADAARIGAAWGRDPALVYTMLDGSDWRRDGADAVRAFARLWHDWPQLAAGQALVALLTVQLDAPAPRRGLRRWLRRPDGLAPGGLPAVAKQLEEAVSGDDRVVGVVLPPLEAVERRDAEDWARRTARRYGLPADRLVRAVDTFYRVRGAVALPMDDLIDELRRILERALFPQEVPT